ncbi:MAG: polysaccharide biosynthesis tyrosine autokinase [Aliarcobacter sp.]|nr:polysaccharide biosynthesis tyrosine autokinase [Aliarcobacter sp.]
MEQINIMANQINNQIQNDEIDLKDLFKTIMKYKYIIALFAIIFTIASAVFAYVKPSVYSSFATIELQEEKNSFNADDALKQAFSGGSVNVENQIEILKSKSLQDKALKELILKTRYFTVKNYRVREFYKNSPFIVIDKILEDNIYGTTFNLTPIDESSFRLEIRPISKYSKRGILALLGVQPLEDYELITYDKVHKYDEDIATEWFSINIKKFAPLENEEYSFSFVHPSIASNIYYSQLSVSQVSELASILQISMEDSVSLRAKDLLNSLFKAYLEQEVQRKTEVANLSLDFIDSQLEEINTKLKSSESDLEKYKETNDVIVLSDKAQTVTKQLVEYESKLQEIAVEENILNNLLQYISKNQNLSGLTVGSINFADPALASLIKNLHELSTQKDTLLLDYTELHPDIQKLNKSIASLRRQIISSLQSNLKQLQQRKSASNDLISGYKRSLETLPKQERELTRLNRHFSVNEKVYSYLLEKRAETAILKSSTISNARVLDEALNFSIPIKPKRILIVLVGLILGIIVGLAYAFLREFLNNTIKNTEEIEKYSTMPIYGVIPLNKNKKTKSIFEEAFRSIRTNLQFLPQNEKSRVIAITSSVSGEGKTTISAKLAEIIAQTDKKVIVLDLDLRKASVHKEFDVPNNIGMSNYLTNQNTLEEVIKNTNEKNVDIITTGALPPNPSELILTDAMKTLLDKLKESYDYIIMDTPPVGLVTDALILMNYSDISFTVVRANYTRKEFIRNLDRLSKEHSHNHVGIILNGVEIGDKYGYGYGVSYGYGYGNGKYYKNR